MLKAQGTERPDPAGLTPTEQLALIAERMRELVERQHACLQKEIEPALRKGGIRRLGLDELNAAQRRHVEAVFEDSIYPVVTPLAVAPDREFPLLAGLGLVLCVRLDGTPEEPGPRHALVAVPKNLPRFLTLPGETGFAYVLLEEVVRAHVGRLFPDVPVRECAAFRITRNADLGVREDLAGDLMAQMREVLVERKESDCVRLEIERSASPEAREFLRAALGVEAADVYAIPGPLDLAALSRLANLSGFDALKIEPWAPQAVPEAPAAESIFAVLKRGNLLLFHPYESYDPVLRLVQEAADDPNVLAIKQVLYRVSDNSPVVAALMRAAERGKHVYGADRAQGALRRSAEHRLGRRLGARRRAGDLRREGLQDAREDLRGGAAGAGRRRALRTCTSAPATTTRKARACIPTRASSRARKTTAPTPRRSSNAITGYAQLGKFRKLEAAPLGIRPRLLELIGGEAERSRQGEAAGIEAKMNSLEDPD
jgi:polyphosphate kinase